MRIHRFSCTTVNPGQTIEFDKVPAINMSRLIVQFGWRKITVVISPLWRTHLPAWFKTGTRINVSMSFDEGSGVTRSKEDYDLKLIVVSNSFGGTVT